MITIFIILITVLISYKGFSDRDFFNRYLFNSYQIFHRKEWHRLISHGFLHANWEHLLVNMFVLYSFGSALEQYFQIYLQSRMVFFLILYFGSMVFSSIYSLWKNKDNFTYNAVGASGAVSAVTFACVFFAPMNKILLFMVIPIPGFVFAILYVAYSYYMSKRNLDNVGHDAHLWGAIFGFFFPLIVKPSLIHVFINGFIE